MECATAIVCFALQIYALAVYLVTRVAATELCARVNARDAFPPSATLLFLSAKLFSRAGAEGVATHSCQLSLFDIITRRRMQMPCRALECDHPQCFELRSFLEMYVSRLHIPLPSVIRLCKLIFLVDSA